MAGNLDDGTFQWQRSGARLLLIFDGHCGICTRFAEWVRERDAAGHVLSLPGQTPGLLQAVGLTKGEVDREAWALDRNGRGYSGAAAINRTLREIGGGWALMARAYRIPGVRQCEDAGYRWFARNRGRFSRWGLIPACERPGATCDSDDVRST